MAYTALALVNRALRLAGNLPEVASLSNLSDAGLFMMRVIDSENRQLTSMANWDWARATSEVQLQPVLAATATMSSSGWSALSISSPSGATIQYSGATDPTSPYVGGWLQATSDGNGDLCRITAVSSATAGSVSNYFGTTGSSKPVTIAQDAFPLPSDFDRPLNLNSYVTAPWAMRGVDPEEFFRARSFQAARREVFLTSAKPEIYTLWGDNSATDASLARLALLVDPFPTDGEAITLHYYKLAPSLTSDAAYPLLPTKWQMYLIHRALEAWHLHRDVNFTKSAAQKALADNMLAKMLVGVERSSDRPMMEPAMQTNYYGAP